MKKVYKVLDQTFKTKEEITEFCKMIINSSSIVSNYHKDFLLALLATDPGRYARKRGDEVKEIFVDKAMYGTKCFYVKRFDNTKDDFSYTQLIGLLKPIKEAQ